jgi:hypothetical protein
MKLNQNDVYNATELPRVKHPIMERYLIVSKHWDVDHELRENVWYPVDVEVANVGCNVVTNAVFPPEHR